MSANNPHEVDAVFARLTGEYNDLVNELVAELDLDAGLEVALQAQRYSELVEELTEELDLDKGVNAALDTLNPKAVDSQSPDWPNYTYNEHSKPVTRPEVKHSDDARPPSQNARVGQVLDDIAAIRNAAIPFTPSRRMVDTLDELANGIRTRYLSREAATELVARAQGEWAWTMDALARSSPSTRTFDAVEQVLNLAEDLKALGHKVYLLWEPSTSDQWSGDWSRT
ncbi:hypothetical protein [Actinomycetospora straminea]|uniref:Uncharacterized protein n=1 Tax=Actinomycetospora straminea TaxID=663607 RepID=A0ABP9F932_9PSEU|nr:hypothetical protein [Actinomycetospora straminea]MDD7936748.1 hypothetical protein [Actinomycetospora straminea]